MKLNLKQILAVVIALFLTLGFVPSSSKNISNNVYASTEIITTLISGLNSPSDIEIDVSTGNIFLSDSGNRRIIKYDSDGNQLASWSSYTTSTSQNFVYPQGISLDGTGNILIADNGAGSSGGLIEKLNLSNGTATVFDLNNPLDVTSDASGNVYVASIATSIFKKTNGSQAATSFTTFQGSDYLFWPMFITFSNNYIWVSDKYNNRVVKFSQSTGAFDTSLGVGDLSQPGGIDINESGDIYVADPGHKNVKKYSSSGTLLASYGSDVYFSDLQGLSISSSGDIYVIDANTVKKIAFSSTSNSSIGDNSLSLISVKKVESSTLTTGHKNGAATNDLSLLVAIPQQWMDTTAKVEFWLNSASVTPKTVTTPANAYSYINRSKALLKSVKSTLLSTYQVDLMQRVTKKDGSAAEAKVAQEAIRGNFTIRLPIPANLLKTQNLGIVYIEEGTGLTANLASKLVIIDGVKYLEFENHRSAVYGFVSDKNNAAK